MGPILPTAAAFNGVNVGPVIEIATYAGVDVYECYCRGKESNIVMRRLHDDWVNITQVFKVASFSKTQRTKILEKESADISHEKIQGGYGRFQGTWIPLISAQCLVAKYEIVDIVVLTLINFKPDPMNMPPRRSKNSVIKKLSPATRIASPSSYNKTPKKKIVDSGNVIAESVTKKTKKRPTTKAAHPSPLQNLVFQTPQQRNPQHAQVNYTIAKQSQQTPMNTIMMADGGSNIQRNNHPQSVSGMLISSTNSGVSVPSTTALPASAPAVSTNSKNIQYSATQKPLQFYPFPVPTKSTGSIADVHIIPEHVEQKQRQPKKLATKQKSNLSRSSSNANKQTASQNAPKMSSFSVIHTGSSKAAASSGSNTSHGSSIDCYSSNDNPTPNSSRSGSPQAKEIFTPTEYKNLILQVLSTEYDTCEPVLPEKLYYPPVGLDINFIIDKQGHSALHWATAMANIPLMKILLTLEADIFHCNDRGFNCVTKSIFYNNCCRTGAFVMVVGLLKMCLITPDNNGRLPLHYLIELSVNKSKDPIVINYYIDTILDALSKEDPHLLKMCLNTQDSFGNTVLHLAALNMNIELCNKLHFMGSSMDIMNSEQQTVSSILVKYNMVSTNANVANTPNPSMMPTPVTSSVPMIVCSQETFRKKQSKPCTPLRPRKHSKKNDSTRHNSLRKEVAETTFSETPLNVTLANTTASTDLSQAPLSSNSKTPSHHDKILALDRIMEFSGSSSLKLNTPAQSTRGFNIAGELQFFNHNQISPLAQGRTLQASKRPLCSHAATIAHEVSGLSQSLAQTIDTNLRKAEFEVKKTSKGIEGIEKSLRVTDKLVSEILNKFCLENVEQLSTVVYRAQTTLAKQITKFANSLEKSQALTLATLVHDEEGKSSASNDDHSSETDQNKDLYRLGVELSILQLKRKHIIEKVTNTKTTFNIGTKIFKYRKLIGLSVDDIDSKLEEIENDLRSTAA